MEDFEDVDEALEDDGRSSRLVSRRKILAALGVAGTAGFTEIYSPNPDYSDWGRFRVQVPGGLPFALEEEIPLLTYSSKDIEEIASSIHDEAEEELRGPTVRETENKIFMDTFYYNDGEILERMQNNDRLVGDPSQITRLLGNKHYATMKMGIKAAGQTRDIRQYLAKDLRVQYINNISELFQQAFQIASEIGEPHFDIGGADERNDQFIGMELYMLGNRGSMAGRYFNTTEIQEYSEDLSQLEEDLEDEADRPGGFEFSL